MSVVLFGHDVGERTSPALRRNCASRVLLTLKSSEIRDFALPLHTTPVLWGPELWGAYREAVTHKF